MLDDVLAVYAFGNHHLYKLLATTKNLPWQLPKAWQVELCMYVHVVHTLFSRLLSTSM